MSSSSHQSSREPSSCQICLHNMNGSSGPGEYTLPCEHSFHLTCVACWLEQHDQCPTCGRMVSTMSKMMIGRSLSAFVSSSASASSGSGGAASTTGPSLHTKWPLRMQQLPPQDDPNWIYHAALLIAASSFAFLMFDGFNNVFWSK